MEFWGIEVKAGKPIKTDPGANYVIHLSQASLGESKNKTESVPLYVNANGKKLVLGTLSHQNCPQLSFDLVFDQDFELSHNWKNGSVHFLGYRAFVPEEDTDDEFDLTSEEESSEEEEELPVAAAENGKAKTDAKTAKANAGKPDAVKQAVKIAEVSNDKKTKDDDDDSNSEDESGSDEEDDSDDEDESDEMSMDESSDDEAEDEETPKKVESSKKRPAEAATPVSAKKGKSVATPQKTDGKKSGHTHTATPHPSKKGGKTSSKSPKSAGGQLSCGSCNKSFGSEGGLESHKKAKHGGK